jgi:hypothetical protein
VRELSESLEKLPNALSQFTDAVDFARSLHALNDAHSLNDRLKNAQAQISDNKYTPISDFFGRMIRETEEFAQPKDTTNVKLTLQNQARMIQWLIRKRQLSTALLMTSEWLISLARYKDLGEDFQAIFYGSERRKYLRENRLKPHVQIHGLYNEIDELRNDYAHVGNRPDPNDAEALVRETQKQLEIIFARINLDTLEITPTEGQDSQ